MSDAEDRLAQPTRSKGRPALLAAAAVLLATAVALPGCLTSAPSSSYETCATGKLLCGSFCCPDDTHYACVNGDCQLIGCDDGLQLCGTGCIPITADCCSQTTGHYCETGEVCCAPSACIPIGTSCCGNGNYCAVGRVCCNGGTQCC